MPYNTVSFLDDDCPLRGKVEAGETKEAAPALRRRIQDWLFWNSCWTIKNN